MTPPVHACAAQQIYIERRAKCNIYIYTVVLQCDVGGNTGRSQSTQCDDDVILTAVVKVSNQGHLSPISF
jgi:hypothetical protein